VPVPLVCAGHPCVDHKPDALQGVDRVICLQNGRVVEDGSAAELLNERRGYRQCFVLPYFNTRMIL